MYFYLYVLFFFTGNSVLLLFMTEGWGCMRMPIFQINMPVRNKWECIGNAPPRLRIAIGFVFWPPYLGDKLIIRYTPKKGGYVSHMQLEKDLTGGEKAIFRILQLSMLV